MVNGVKYSVRTFAMPDGSHRADYWPTVLAEVGTVRAYHFPEATQFPPADVMAEFPGYVPARINPERAYAVEYQGEPPTVFLNHLGWYEVQL